MIHLTELAATTSASGHRAPVLPILLLVIIVAVAIYFIVRRKRRD